MGKKLSRFSVAEKSKIMALHEEGVKPKTIARMFKCSTRKIYDLIRTSKLNCKFTDEEIDLLLDYLKKNFNKDRISTASLKVLFPNKDYYALRNKKISLLKQIRKIDHHYYTSFQNPIDISTDMMYKKNKVYRVAKIQALSQESDEMKNDAVDDSLLHLEISDPDCSIWLNSYSESFNRFIDASMD